MIGRCLLRVQQYERLLKAVLVHHELTGPAEELQAIQVGRVEEFADRTLGQLVKALFESYVVVEGAPAVQMESGGDGRIAMSFRYRLELTSARRDELKMAIGDLVKLRNDLVHHFIEQFDVWTEDGCAAAVGHLQHCYQRIDERFQELRQWAENLDQARSMAVSFAQSRTFEDLVLNGIAPDGTVDWAHSGIVRALREVFSAHAVEGWLRLDEAKAWIAEHYPDQEPARYGCKTWPQVVSESRAFQLEYRLDGERKKAWIRPRG